MSLVIPRLKVGNRSISHASLRIAPVADDSGVTVPPTLPAHVKEIRYQDGVSLVLPRGVHMVPLQRGDGGEYTANASLTLVTEAWIDWLEGFPVADTAGITDFDFTLEVMWKPPRASQIQSVKWEKASIISIDEGSASGGTDGVMTTLGWHVQQIFRNGRSLVARDQDR